MPCFFPHKGQPSLGGNINQRSEPGGDFTARDFHKAEEQTVYWAAKGDQGVAILESRISSAAFVMNKFVMNNVEVGQDTETIR